MYMVDSSEQKQNSFGYTNQDGTVECVNYDKHNKMVVLGVEGCDAEDVWHYPKDIANLIKDLQHMQKYLVDEEIIK